MTPINSLAVTSTCNSTSTSSSSEMPVSLPQTAPMSASTAVSVNSSTSTSSSSTSSFQKVFEIPEYCTKLMSCFAGRPLLTGIAKNCKVIPLESHIDARICGIFTENTIKVLGNERAWHVRDAKNIEVFKQESRLSHCYDQGLVLSLYDKVRPCPIDELGAAYSQVLKEFTTGWVSARIEENPNIMFKQNPDDFYLFLKKSSLTEEDSLIRFLATKFSMRESVECHHEWLTLKSYEYGKTYLWIKKTAFEDVVNKFGFKLEPQ